MLTRSDAEVRSTARRRAWAGAVVVLTSFGVLTGSLGAEAQTTAKRNNKRPVPAGIEGPADYPSAHFLLHTDLTSKEARELLKRLETMLDLISKYWGRPPVGLIECYVVQDLDKWPSDSLDPHGRMKIQEGAGVTLTQSLIGPGNKKVVSKSVVYAVADHGTPQHEAVHAYCGQNFGTPGPLWYAEGMAEMGQYWRANDSAVHIHPGVLEYLQSSPPQSLKEIVDTRSNRFTGDSWQNYAWRWALCNLLANNTNYRDRFRPLGLSFLAEEKASFEQTYGAMADEISFEYLFFIRHIDQGYRVDLCSWDWKKKFKPLTGSAPVSTKILADHGWQASGVTCAVDQEYDYSAQGTWQTSKTTKEASADGNQGGAGRLVGILMQDFKLGKPFELGSYGSFKAPGDGKLYLRCQDKWNELADNKGAMNVKLKLSGKGNPLARPKEKAAANSKTEAKSATPSSAGDQNVETPAPSQK